MAVSTLGPSPLARLGSVGINLGVAMVSLMVSAGLCEAVARSTGHRPYEPTIPLIRVEPGGRMQEAHPVLGYTYLPGRFQITFDNGDSWATTHLPDTHRITRPLAGYSQPWSGPSLWLFGCSFVHGWGLEDGDTLGWKLHEQLPQLDIVNFGVGGYGTVQSLLQFREALRTHAPPAVAVLAYAGFHDERSTALRRWRKGTYEYEAMGTTASPYARLDGRGALTFFFERPRYFGFELLRRSAVLELIDEACMNVEDRLRQSHRVSELLVEQFAREAAASGVRFVVAGISLDPGTSAMLDYCGAHGTPAVDVAQVLKGRNRIRWDGHPSGRANRLSAGRLAGFLRSLPGLDTTPRTAGKSPSG